MVGPASLAQPPLKQPCGSICRGPLAWQRLLIPSANNIVDRCAVIISAACLRLTFPARGHCRRRLCFAQRLRTWKSAEYMIYRRAGEDGWVRVVPYR